MSEPSMSEPLIWNETVREEWIDYNGHLSEGYYVVAFGFATDALMIAIGMTPEYLAETGTSLFTVEAHVRYLDQILPGGELEIRTSVIGVTGKSVWLWHEMWCEGKLRATEEVLLLHVDTEAGRAAEFPGPLREVLQEKLVPVPPEASRRIAPRKA